MKSRLTPVFFKMDDAFNPDANMWEIGRQVVKVYKLKQNLFKLDMETGRQVVKVYELHRNFLFGMKERRKQWFVSSNPLPMRLTDNYLLQKAAKKFKESSIRSYSTYHSRIIYR